MNIKQKHQNEVKSEIISILDDLENIELDGFFYNLHINRDCKKEKCFNINDLRNIINKYDNIDSYGLSVMNFDRLDDKYKYLCYYNRVEFIFTNCNMNIMYYSNYLKITRSGLFFHDFDKLFEFYNECNCSSKRLFDIIGS